MILFIDGFDLHVRTGDNLPGARDSDKYWYTPPLNAPRYTTGYETGQALRIAPIPSFGLNGGGYSSSNKIPRTLDEIRVYFVARRGPDDPVVGAEWYALCQLDWGSGTVEIQISASGGIRLTRNGGWNDGASGTVLQTSVFSFTTDWQEFEFYFNSVTGVVQVYRNGSLFLSGSAPGFSLGGQHPVLRWNRTRQYYVDIDHIVVTDGEKLQESFVHAIAPTAAFDRYESSNGMLYGNLVIGDVSYRTQADSVTATSVPNQSFPNAWTDNSEQVVYWLYPRQPHNNQPWASMANVNSLQGWGVCSANLDGPGGPSIRMSTLGLSVVYTKANGHPLITVLGPSGLTYLSGSWVRSDPEMSYRAHLNQIPRTQDREDDRWLTIDEDGCILFVTSAGGSRDTIETTGITFAEEFREDFVDWARVYVGGVPFESFFITGYTILGEGNKKFQSTYVTINYEYSNNAGAFVQNIWDYSTDPNTGRWSSRQQIYRPGEGYKHKTTRLKIRGHGKTIQMKFSSEYGKDYIINGWSTYATGNATI
jgi:hypothetical protein